MASATPPNANSQDGKQGSENNGKRAKGSDKDLLVLQVRAFLEAAEDVDIDVETMEDLVDMIPDQEQEEGEGEGPHDEDNDLGLDDDTEVDEILYNLDDEAQDVWTFDEVKEMISFLKERGMSAWLTEYVSTRNIPVPKLLHAFGMKLCDELKNKKPSTLLYFLKVAIARELRFRERLTQYNTIADAVNLIRSSRRILILTGAGISVSCGIPDFRSRDGLYASLKDRNEYDLDDPQQMFDINYFRENPAVFYSFAHQIYPSNFIPSPCHRFIKLVEDKGQLLRNYTQNIDTLETVAGVKRVLQCHGSFTTATCLQCRRRITVAGSEVEVDILKQKVSACVVCNQGSSAKKKKKMGKKKAKGQWDSNDEDESDGPFYPGGIMKPDITFFGEKLTDEFDNALEDDREKVDLLLVIGTSLKVSPVADILSHLPHSVPQILINKTPIRHINPDIVLLGNADDIVRHLCSELQWVLPPDHIQLNNGREHLRRTNSAETSTPAPRAPERIGSSHVWLYDGAEGGKWLQNLKQEFASQVPTPASSKSKASTRASTPGSGDRKRIFLDVVAPDERALKRVKSGESCARS